MTLPATFVQGRIQLTRDADTPAILTSQSPRSILLVGCLEAIDHQPGNLFTHLGTRLG